MCLVCLPANLCAPRRGLRPSWGEIFEATDLLRLHKEKLLKHRRALAAAHTLFDPVQSAPYLAAQMKFMYRVFILEETLERILFHNMWVLPGNCLSDSNFLDMKLGPSS